MHLYVHVITGKMGRSGILTNKPKQKNQKLKTNQQNFQRNLVQVVKNNELENVVVRHIILLYFICNRLKKYKPKKWGRAMSVVLWLHISIFIIISHIYEDCTFFNRNLG